MPGEDVRRLDAPRVELASRGSQASSHVRMLCGKATDGTRDQSYTQEGCAARSRQGSVHEARQGAPRKSHRPPREIVVVLAVHVGPRGAAPRTAGSPRDAPLGVFTFKKALSKITGGSGGPGRARPWVG
jgi:hypothetical protein